MLRINCLADDAFRNDILKLVKNGLREAVPKAIAEKFAEEGWLDKRFQNAIKALNLEERVCNLIRSRETWQTRIVREAIEEVVNGKISATVAALNTLATERLEAIDRRLTTTLTERSQRIIDDYGRSMRAEEDLIRRVVREELRKMLVEKVA